MNESRCDVHKVDNEAEDVNNSALFWFDFPTFYTGSINMAFSHRYIIMIYLK